MIWLNSKMNRRFYRQTKQQGFTLVELLIVIGIIGILTGMAAYVMAGATTDAKITRTRTLIQRIHLLLLDKWETYDSRALQLTTASGSSLETIQTRRLWAMRDLMRMEMPDRKQNVVDDPLTTFALPEPAVHRRYRRRMAEAGGWTEEHEGAECLYLILDGIEDEFGSALQHFKPSEIGDVDGDGMPEILDAWGNPISFIRWPEGYDSSIQAVEDPPSDPFDPFGRDSRASSFTPHLILPLVYSAGPDGSYGVIRDAVASGTMRYSDPYLKDSNGNRLGARIDSSMTVDVSLQGEKEGSLDNIDNHNGVAP